MSLDNDVLLVVLFCGLFSAFLIISFIRYDKKNHENVK